MKYQLDNMHVDDLPYLERDLNIAQKVYAAKMARLSFIQYLLC